MNIAGPLATGIFVITMVTVLAALLSYLIFKARERKKKKVARPAGGISLQYFVEFQLPGMAEADVGSAAAIAVAPEVARSYAPGGVLMLAAVALVMVGGGIGVYVWTRGGGTAAGTGSALAKADPRIDPPPTIAVRSRKPSLFPAASLDLNRDGRLQREERALLHQRVPQFIVVTCDDNGSVGGLEWMKGELGRRGIWADLTFFMTGNYLSGRKNYLGGPVDSWWQTLLRDSHLGLHGTTHAEGADTWAVDRWIDEHSTVQDEIVKRLKLPAGWDWARYPWGTRAPFLMLTDAYFAALPKLKRKVVFDASIVVHPGGAKMVPPARDEVRDLTWPFTLDNPLPEDVDPPYLPAHKNRARLGRHLIWEIPVYAWWMTPPKQPAQWQPSLDYNLWKFFGCEGKGPNPAIVKTVIDNLKKHYDGNRAPFHIGFHANAFDPHEGCKRATAASLFDKIQQLAKDTGQIRFISMPHLLAWMEENAT